MKTYFLIFCIILVCCQPNEDLQFMKEVNEILSKESGTFAVAYKNLKTGETLLINEHEIFHAASTMKTPVMAEVFKQAEAGKFSLNDSVVLKNEFKSIVDGSLFSLSPADDSEQESYNHL
jgi:beta-lactamase class A